MKVMTSLTCIAETDVKEENIFPIPKKRDEQKEKLSSMWCPYEKKNKAVRGEGAKKREQYNFSSSQIALIVNAVCGGGMHRPTLIQMDFFSLSELGAFVLPRSNFVFNNFFFFFQLTF